MKTTATKTVRAVKPVRNDLSEQQDKATPRPWISRKELVLESDFLMVAKCAGETDYQAEANAALIVKAVNSYDALRAVADSAWTLRHDEGSTPKGELLAELDQALAALAAVDK